jgi:hypothetical protein
MSYKSRTTFQSENAARYTAGVKKWQPQELEDHLENLSDSVQWNDAVQTLTDAGTVTWDYSAGAEAKVTLGGNRTLSITNLPTGRVVYGCLEVYQNGTGGFSLTLPTPRTTNGTTINSAASSKSLVTFRYDGTKFEFNISQHA